MENQEEFDLSHMDTITNTNKIHIITAVWGEEFISFFLKFTLPSHLHAISQRQDISFALTYKIYTAEGDLRFVLDLIQQLYSDISLKIEVCPLNFDPQLDVLGKMTQAHNKALQEAIEAHAKIVLLMPDQIVGTSSFKKIIKSIANGKKLLLTPSIRISKERFIEKVKNSPSKFFDGSFENRALASLGLDSFHSLSRNLCWNTSSKVSCWPSHLIWMLGQSTCYVKGFHLHPIMIAPHPQSIIKSTLDGDPSFLQSLAPSENEWEIIRDSDELLVFELTPEKRSEPTRRKSYLSLCFWILSCTGPIHREFFKHGCLIHSKGKEKKSELQIVKIDRICSWVISAVTNPVLSFFLKSLKKIKNSIK